jgi:hypothetical protein
VPGLHPAGAPLDWLDDALIGDAELAVVVEGPWDTTPLAPAEDWPPSTATGGVQGFKVVRPAEEGVEPYTGPAFDVDLGNGLHVQHTPAVVDGLVVPVELAEEYAADLATQTPPAPDVPEETSPVAAPSDAAPAAPAPEDTTPDVSRETPADPELTPCPSCGATDGDCTTKTGKPHVARTRAIEAARAARDAAETTPEGAPAPEPPVVTEHPPVALDSVEQRWEMYLLAREKSEEWAELAKACRADVEVALGDREIGTIAGKTVVVWEHRKVRRWDQKAFRRDHPEFEHEYLRETEERRFVVARDQAAEGGQEGTEG